MLDIDTLDALHDLTAETLYAQEVMRLPTLSKRETEELVARARAGDPDARNSLVVSCLAYALGKARFLYFQRKPQHDDLLDLVQEAGLHMVECLNQALAANSPVAYLRVLARQAISLYCTYHAGLIQKPQYTLAVLKKHQHPATVADVESLDKPLYDDGKRIRVELFEAPEPQPEPDEKRQRAHYAVLYQALKALPRKDRSVIIQLYGLYGQPSKAAVELGKTGYIHSLAFAARKKLRKHLEEHLAQMFAPMPEPEEEA